MRKIAIAITVVVALMMALAVPVMAGGNGAFRGAAEDPSWPSLGEIEFLSNNSGYHFWFTVDGSKGAIPGVYVDGHSYHNVYKTILNDTAGWAGPIIVGGGGRPPYNMVGHQGEQAYYKIFDTTTDTQVVP
jgi:hypothetical protein